jgi:hypothetical protein
LRLARLPRQRTSRASPYSRALPPHSRYVSSKESPALRMR